MRSYDLRVESGESGVYVALLRLVGFLQAESQLNRLIMGTLRAVDGKAIPSRPCKLLVAVLVRRNLV